MAVIQRTTDDTATILRIGGGFIAIFGLVMGLLALLWTPGTCTFVGAIQLLISGCLFIIGVISFFLGNVLVRRKIG